jgi:hypothetical protein
LQRLVIVQDHWPAAPSRPTAWGTSIAT